MSTITLKDLTWLNETYTQFLTLLRTTLPANVPAHLSTAIRSLDIQTLLILGFLSYLLIWLILAFVKTLVRSFVWAVKVAVYLGVVVAVLAVAVQVSPGIGGKLMKGW
ncbi:hypothetical protein HDU67_002314 [Dinochytrium kinnereticum]|nr:hypothetical protein HDU67_002314 [Dinochytrium kinnereticum]